MATPGNHAGPGSVDPETLYSRQQCIGMLSTCTYWGVVSDTIQVAGASERSTKGIYRHAYR